MAQCRNLTSRMTCLEMDFNERKREKEQSIGRKKKKFGKQKLPLVHINKSNYSYNTCRPKELVRTKILECPLLDINNYQIANVRTLQLMFTLKIVQ